MKEAVAAAKAEAKKKQASRDKRHREEARELGAMTEGEFRRLLLSEVRRAAASARQAAYNSSSHGDM